MPHTHIQSHTITKNHKTSQTFTTFIHKHTQYSQQITIHHTKLGRIIQTHKTSQYSQKITGGSQKITPIYIYIYIYTHTNVHHRKKILTTIDSIHDRPPKATPTSFTSSRKKIPKTHNDDHHHQSITKNHRNHRKS